MFGERFSVLLLLLCTAADAAFAAQTTRYAVLTGDGHRGGEQVVERGDDGYVTVRYRFKDNGRGPEFVERFRLGPGGVLAEFEVKGESMMGAPVDERFVQGAGRAEWKSTTEQGSAASDGSALYVPLMSSFELIAVGIAAVAARPDGKLPLLPSGTLSQRVLDEFDLEADVDPARQRRRVQLIAQTGLGLTPALAWATAGPQPRLFAVHISGWLTVVEEGWEAQVPQLVQRQRAAEARLLQEMAAATRQPLPGLTVLRNARIFDSETARLGAASDIYVLRGRIAAIRAAGDAGAAAAKPDAEIDAGGRIVLPGLFDMHAHVDRWEGGLHLAAGVTTVRDMGNENAKLQQMIDETAAGTLLAPQIVPCGFLEGDSPYASRLGFVIKTLQQARDAVDWYAARGYPQLKIYNSFPREMVREIVAYAHARGMRVSGHVPVHMLAQDAVEAGFDELQHINQVTLNFVATRETETRTPERFYLPAEKAAGLDLDSAPVRDFLALLKSRQTVIDPTLAVFDFIRQREGQTAAPYAAIASHLPPDVQRGLKSASMKMPDEATAQRYDASYARMVELVGRLIRAGIPIVAGTDGFAGFALQAELALYVQAGMTPAQALQVATRDAARYTRTADDRGSIAVGKRADLVLVDGDPLADIADIRKVALVLTQGSLIAPSAVYQRLGIAPFVGATPALVKNTAAR